MTQIDRFARSEEDILIRRQVEALRQEALNILHIVDQSPPEFFVRQLQGQMQRIANDVHRIRSACSHVWLEEYNEDGNMTREFCHFCLESRQVTSEAQPA